MQRKTNPNKIDLEIPPDHSLGDYAFPCFELAKKLKKKPARIALDLKGRIKKPAYVEKIETKGPYLNFFIDKEKLADETLKTIVKEKSRYGSSNEKKKIVIESPGPNTNKPLHLGHLRNMSIGISLSNIFRKRGNKGVNVDIINDRGIHICKSMLAYKKFGENKEPNKKPDHFVGDFYVLYEKKVRENPKLEKELRGLLKSWESKDESTSKLWKKMNNWALKGIGETYKRFGMNIDKAYKESAHYAKGKSIVMEGFKKRLFKKDKEGGIIINLEEKGLGKKFF